MNTINPDHHQDHILVVDDDRRLRDLLQRYLIEHNFTVSTAADALQAKNLFKKNSFDLIILDVMMPGENGFDLTKTFRKNSDVPILLLSARGDTEARIVGLEAGADDYLSKPFEPLELLLRIQSIIKRS